MVLRELTIAVAAGSIAASVAVVAGSGRDEASSAGPVPIRACGAGVGGYRIRAAGLDCAAARRFVRHPRLDEQIQEFRFRDPDAEPIEISREVVRRSRDGWTCLAQALPRVRVTQFLCVRGRQVLLWRFS
jgi:hypothetical protein